VSITSLFFRAFESTRQFPLAVSKTVSNLLLCIACVGLSGCALFSIFLPSDEQEHVALFSEVEVSKEEPSSFDVLAAYTFGVADSVLVTSTDGVFGIVDVSKGRFVEKLQRLNPGFSVLAVEKKRGLLAVGGSGLVVLYDLRDLSIYKVLRKVRAAPRTANFSPDGKELLLGATDGRVYRWLFDKSGRFQRGRSVTLESYIGHSSVITAVQYHPSGRIFFSSDGSGALFAWLAYDADPHDGYYDRNLFGNRFFANEPTRLKNGVTQSEAINHIAVSRDGRWIVTSTVAGALNLWAVQGFKSTTQMQAHSGLIYDIALSGNDDVLLSLGRDGFFRQWSIVSVGISTDTLEPAYELSQVQEQSVPGGRALGPLTRTSVAVIFRKGDLKSIPLQTVNTE
jgi:WD40 repeat protein